MPSINGFGFCWSENRCTGIQKSPRATFRTGVWKGILPLTKHHLERSTTKRINIWNSCIIQTCSSMSLTLIIVLDKRNQGDSKHHTRNSNTFHHENCQYCCRSTHRSCKLQDFASSDWENRPEPFDPLPPLPQPVLPLTFLTLEESPFPLPVI